MPALTAVLAAARRHRSRVVRFSRWIDAFQQALDRTPGDPKSAVDRVDGERKVASLEGSIDG